MSAAAIDRGRFAADLEQLGAIGWTDGRGLDRTAFSPAHREARAWFLARAQEAGLQTSVDSAGNHSATLPASAAAATGGRTPRTLLLGSHLDSVPGGGRLDGALGVVAALEVLRAVADAGLELPVALEAIDFTDEEGTAVGTLGSWALAGALSVETLASPPCGREALLAHLAGAGLTEPGLHRARRDPATLVGFLELHIEQGPVLERAGAEIGIVTGIRGTASFEVIFDGAARHAGTTPMDARRDAGLGAAAFTLALRERIAEAFGGCVATVGDVRLEPGAANVVPGRARLAVECRSLDDAELDALASLVDELAAAQARRWNLVAHVMATGRWAPAPTDTRARDAIARAAGAAGADALELPSGAGHDAQVMAAIAPTGMVFVPSRGGISHHPDEHTDVEQCARGCEVLLGAALNLVAAAA